MMLPFCINSASTFIFGLIAGGLCQRRHNLGTNSLRDNPLITNEIGFSRVFLLLSCGETMLAVVGEGRVCRRHLESGKVG